MLKESVIQLLKNGMWDLATCANGEPNVVPSCSVQRCYGGWKTRCWRCFPGDDFAEHQSKRW